jgi:hypothetical protein
MKKFIPVDKLSKKEQKRILKEHRKPPIPPSRKSDSKAERDRKNRRIEEQRLKQKCYRED